MRPLELSKDVVPIAKFKARASEIVNRVKKEQRPTVITLNGEPAAVLISPEDFDRQVYVERIRSGIEQGLADFDAGRVHSDDELGHWADERYGKLKRKSSKRR